MTGGLDRRLLLAGLVGSGALSSAGAAAAEQPAGSPRPLPTPPPAPKVLPSAWTAAPSVPLWPGPAPGDADFRPQELPADWPPVFLRNTRSPSLHVFRPRRPNGCALLVMPGGSYQFVSIANEGVDVADRFCAWGYTVFVLAYRLPAEGWRARAVTPLQDAQRAMRLLKARAGVYGIDPERISAIGFSAGGHLAASLATAYAEPVYTPVDAVDQRDARPAATGLIYPVITMTERFKHQGSRDNLLGPAPDAALVAARSPEQHLTPQTPPLFLAHACDDPVVPVDNSVMMFEAARASHVPVEAHLFQEGGHAFGVGLPGTPTSLWPDLFHLWLGRALGA